MNKNVLRLEIKCPIIQSFKNRKRAILDQNTGKLRTLTQKDVKKRMVNLEENILCALYSAYQTNVDAMGSECPRLSPIAWFGPYSGLMDDSLNQIPSASFDTEYVSEGEEGVVIEITPL